MKKIISAILIISLVFSVVSCCAFAEEEPTVKQVNDEATRIIMHVLTILVDKGTITKADFAAILTILNCEKMHDNDQLSDQTYKSYKEIYAMMSQDLPNEYSFGQGTFVVGTDLKAGTYDITCKSASDDGFNDSMSGFSDFYAGQGMDDYADMFNSISGMYGSIAGMTVETIGKDGLMDKYLTLKSGENARIILEDGMKLELSGGSADLVFVR